jgi:hypothetical protein
MRRIVMVGVIALATSTSAFAEDERLPQSQALVGRFAGELMTALQDAIESGGPAAAIRVCGQQAPEIAATLSRQSGAHVSRVSSRFRNPQNAPDAWQLEALGQLRDMMPQTPAFPDPTALPDHFELDSRGGARYLKAIAIAPLCLTCHGETIAAEVADQLDEDYPFDRATGYRLGELRGAFSVDWPAP